MFTLLLPPDDIYFLTAWWIVYFVFCILLVMFAGIMSGLTLGLMSLDPERLEIFKRTGSSTTIAQADAISPVLNEQRRLHVTLLLCNCLAMEALSYFLDKVCNPVIAMVVTVTLVLLLGEVIPQSVCTRYRLKFGATFIKLVRFLMLICYPIASPIGKFLDWLIGRDDAPERRAQLKALVSFLIEKAANGELEDDEKTIINGALDLTLKTAENAVTPLQSTYFADADSILNWDELRGILINDRSRSHIPILVYRENHDNIIGLLLMKNLTIRVPDIPRFRADTPLYDIFNKLKDGNNHIVNVIREENNPQADGDIEKSNVEVGDRDGSELTEPLLPGPCEKSMRDYPGECSNAKNANQQCQENVTAPNSSPRGEVIGIITMENIFEELLKGIQAEANPAEDQPEVNQPEDQPEANQAEDQA